VADRQIRRYRRIEHLEKDVIELKRKVEWLESRYMSSGIDWDDVEFFTVREVAEKLKVSVGVVLRRLRSGKWPWIRIGHEYRIPAFWLVGRLAVPVEQYHVMRHAMFGGRRAQDQEDKPPRPMLPLQAPHRRSRVRDGGSADADDGHGQAGPDS